MKYMYMQELGPGRPEAQNLALDIPSGSWFYDLVPLHASLTV